ncbi:PR domain zinc finger protein 13-like [Littorina saxatilis]
MTNADTLRKQPVDTLGTGRNSPKRAKVSPWRCSREGDVTVVAATDIPAHVTAGPYPGGLDFGARTSDHQPAGNVIKVAWRDGRIITADDNGDEDLGRKPRPQQANQDSADDQSRWMMALQPARDRLEQNVEVVTEAGRLVLHVLKRVRQGERLLLWYSDSLARAFGVPILTPAHIRGNQQYMCTACHTTFQYPNTLKAHILFKCDASTSSSTASHSPSLTSPSAFTVTSPTSPYRLIGSGPSAFRRSSASAQSPDSLRGSSSKTHDLFSASRRREWEQRALLSPDRTRSSDSSGRMASIPDRRAMTPDSSTDESSALNLSTRKPLCQSSSSGLHPALSIPGCHSAAHHSPPGLPRGGNTLPLPTGPQPIQIFNHIHPPGLPALPLPLEQHVALRLYYPWLASLPDPTNPAKLLCASVPTSAHAAAAAVLEEQRRHHLAGFHPPHSHHHLHHHHPQSVGGFMFPPHFLGPDPAEQQSLLMTSTGRDGGVLPTVPLTVSTGSSLANSMSVGGSLSGSYPGSSSKPRLPLMPVPSEKEGEPLDLLPPSFFANKSCKGHLCIYCGKLYSRKYGLKIHLRTHTGYKPLKCKVCLRPFGDPSNLNKHVRLHAEGDTPYRCDYCGKVLVRRRDLERHIRSRHPSESKDDDDVSTECVDSEVDVTSETESTADSGEQEIEVT